MPRKYTKKNNDYWGSLSRGQDESNNQSKNPFVVQANFTPELIDDPLYVYQSKASRLTGPSEKTGRRKNQIATRTATERFNNIAQGLLPYEYSGDSVGIKDAIVLCQKAYFNIAVFKSTLDLLSEFANSDIYLDEKTGNASSRKFVEAWFKKIRLFDLKEQFFREYYRSGNVFLYKLESALLKKTINRYGLSDASSKVPVKYVVLNPSDIIVNEQLSFGSYKYAKVLTPFELTRLKKRKTQEEKELFDSLPKTTQKDIDASGGYSSNEIAIDLMSDSLFAVFYKKQDYEPLAVPMGFSVLDDLNKKMELKNVDQAIARSIENVILLITMGNEPEKGGINAANITAMQELLKNKSVGRVLVSDYTTKADFIFPDLRKVIGKEKYEVLNKDIEQGLGNILLGESKYSDTGLKLKIFFQRLEEARNRFLNDFLQKEIDAVCKSVGYIKPPKAKFIKKDVIAAEDLQKLTTRMMELGILTPEQGMDTIHKGEFPLAEDLKEQQMGYKKDREDGYYLPLVSTQLLMPEPEVGNPSKKTATTSGPSGGRPTGANASIDETYSTDNLLNVLTKIKNLEIVAQNLYKKKLSVKTLKKEQKENISKVCEKVVLNCKVEEWDKKVKAIVSNSSELLKLDVHPEIFAIAAKHGLADYPAALLFHAK